MLTYSLFAWLAEINKPVIFNPETDWSFVPIMSVPGTYQADVYHIKYECLCQFASAAQAVPLPALTCLRRHPIDPYDQEKEVLVYSILE